MKPIFLVAGLLVAAASSLAQSGSSPAAAQPLPHDTHEGLTVSVDEYTSSARAKEKLGKGNPVPVGILPVEVFLKNDTGSPIKLGIDTIQLEVRSGSHHQDIDWLDPIEVASAVAHPDGPPAPHARRFPIGPDIPKDGKRDKILEVLKPVVLDADIIPPHNTIHGFLFFDVGHDMPSPADTSLYVPDLTVVPGNKPLMFFEVMLGPPGTAQQ